MTEELKPMRTDREKLEILLAAWEKKPNIMLSCAGANTTGVVAKWIKDALVGVPAQGVPDKSKLDQLRWFISDAYCAERNCGCSRDDINAGRGACWDYAARITQAMPMEVAALCDVHAQGKPRKIETGRKCAVCGRTTSPSGQKDTYGFKTILSRNGFTGDKAHRECVANLSEKTS